MPTHTVPKKERESWTKTIKGHDDFVVYEANDMYALLVNREGQMCLHRKDGITWSAPSRAIAHLIKIQAQAKQEWVEMVKKVLPTHKGKMLSRSEVKKALDSLLSPEGDKLEKQE